MDEDASGGGHAASAGRLWAPATFQLARRVPPPPRAFYTAMLIYFLTTGDVNLPAT